MKPLHLESNSTSLREAAITKSSNPPKLQLQDLQPITLNSSVSARNGPIVLPEVKSLYNSPTTCRSKPINPINEEEFKYRKNYYNTLDQSDSFRKKSGYFTDFANHNKLVTDLYTRDKSPVSMHSRYVSKPVFFTTLNTKNKLSEFITVDHSELLEITKRNSTNTSRIINTSGYRDDSVNLFSDKKANKSTSNSMLPTVMRNGERNKSEVLPKFYDHSPKKNKREATLPTKGEEESYLLSGNNFTSLNSVRNRSKPGFLESLGPDKFRKSPEQKTQATLDKLKDFHELQKSLRYQTKELTDALTSHHTKRLDDDTNKYIEHKGNLDYERSCRIAVSQLDEHKKFLKIHPGSPKAYLAQGKKETYKELKANQEIERFEENLLGWMKSVPNFGKQRWTYEKDWEFKIV